LPAQARVLQVTDALADACRGEHVPALVGSLGEAQAGAVLSVDTRASAGDVLTRVCAAARLTGQAVIGVGSPAGGIGEVRRSLTEAAQVAAAAAGAPPAPYYRLADLRLRGLLQLLRGDARVETFVARELGALLRYDEAHGTDLAGLLATYLAEAGNKAATAARAHLARPTLYERLARIERVLGVSLDSGESRTSLHVALLAREAGAGQGPGPAPAEARYWS
jgi:purine catabolism regulator